MFQNHIPTAAAFSKVLPYAGQPAMRQYITQGGKRVTLIPSSQIKKELFHG